MRRNLIKLIFILPLVIILIIWAVMALADPLSITSCNGVGNALSLTATGLACGMPISETGVGHIGSQAIAPNPGLLSLGTKTVTVTGITGMKVNDYCWANYTSTQTIAAGLDIGGCRASADGQADIVFSTPLIAGLSLGAINMTIIWMGP